MGILGDCMDLKALTAAEIEAKRDLLEHLAITIGENPELGFEEINASRLLSSALADGGFAVEWPLAELKTAFRATLGSGKPRVAFLCEYDALPDLGHACGHNLIGVASLGAALGLAPILKDLKGSVVVLGTPAEETGSGKVILLNAGYFDDVDAALMFHPASHNLLMATTNALDAYEFVFTGKTAHAADSPEEGINALDALLALFNGINALRGSLASGVRIHGIISEGGVAPNIVPARAIGRFYLRAPERKLLDQVTAKVFEIAKGASLMTGAQVTWNQFELSTDNMVPNHPLALAFGANLQKLGGVDIEEFAESRASSDIGNISQVVPTIHPYLSIGQGLTAHTVEFAKASVSKKGIETAILAAKALAHTALDLFTNPLLLNAVWREHERQACKE